jgi:hypothetical protein
LVFLLIYSRLTKSMDNTSFVGIFVGIQPVGKMDANHREGFE